MDLKKCSFYVIYWADIARTKSIADFRPPFIKRWELTEDDEGWEYDYLAEESGDPTWKNGKHRKWTALLDWQHFRDFTEKTGLYMEETETLGSITEYGWLPAVMFSNPDVDQDVINQCAYVSPLPPKDHEGLGTQEEWEEVRETMLDWFR